MSYIQVGMVDSSPMSKIETDEGYEPEDGEAVKILANLSVPLREEYDSKIWSEGYLDVLKVDNAMDPRSCTLDSYGMKPMKVKRMLEEDSWIATQATEPTQRVMRMLETLIKPVIGVMGKGEYKKRNYLVEMVPMSTVTRNVSFSMNIERVMLDNLLMVDDYKSFSRKIEMSYNLAWVSERIPNTEACFAYMMKEMLLQASLHKVGAQDGIVTKELIDCLAGLRDAAVDKVEIDGGNTAVMFYESMDCQDNKGMMNTIYKSLTSFELISKLNPSCFRGLDIYCNLVRSRAKRAEWILYTLFPEEVDNPVSHSILSALNAASMDRRYLYNQFVDARNKYTRENSIGIGYRPYKAIGGRNTDSNIIGNEDVPGRSLMAYKRVNWAIPIGTYTAINDGMCIIGMTYGVGVTFTDIGHKQGLSIKSSELEEVARKQRRLG